MGVMTMIQNIYNKLFRPEADKVFNADTRVSDVMETAIETYYSITSGTPWWTDPDDDVRSLNMAGYIDDVTAGLVTLDLSIDTGGTPRGQALQKQADYIMQSLTDKVSEGLGNVGIMFKPNGKSVDYYEAGSFAPTDSDSNGNIKGCVFQTRLERGKEVFTRLEWHRYDDDGKYLITNYAYRAPINRRGYQHGIGTPCLLTDVKDWENIEPEVALENVEQPLFAYFRNPCPNRVDRTSALGVPIWAYAVNELRDLDIAWSRKSTEVMDSKHVTFVPQQAVQYANRQGDKLPRYVRGVEMGVGVASDAMIHEHVSTMLTDQRISDINSILAMISTKCGFSQGFLQLNEKTGLMTATQVEADDQETVRTIKNIRDTLQRTLTDLLYACNVMEDLYGDSVPEAWADIKEGLTFDFADITYNYEEDRALWWKYRIQGDVPPWMYYNRFEGMSEEEAKAMLSEAQPENNYSLFGDEYAGTNKDTESEAISRADKAGADQAE